MPKMRRGPFTNDLFAAEGQRHYVTLFTSSRTQPEGEPVVREPEKCAEWRWVEWDCAAGAALPADPRI